MQDGGTHEDFGSVEVDSSSEAAPLTSATFWQQTVWIFVLFQQCSVPASVLAQLFRVTTDLIRKIAKGRARPETVDTIKNQFDEQFTEAQRLQLDERLRMFLSGTSPVLSQHVLTEVRKVCQQQLEAAKHTQLEAAKRKKSTGALPLVIRQLEDTITVMDEVLPESSMTAALNNAGIPVAQATGDKPLEDQQTSASDWVFVF